MADTITTAEIKADLGGTEAWRLAANPMVTAADIRSMVERGHLVRSARGHYDRAHYLAHRAQMVGDQRAAVFFLGTRRGPYTFVPAPIAVVEPTPAATPEPTPVGEAEPVQSDHGAVLAAIAALTAEVQALHAEVAALRSSSTPAPNVEEHNEAYYDAAIPVADACKAESVSPHAAKRLIRDGRLTPADYLGQGSGRGYRISRRTLQQAVEARLLVPGERWGAGGHRSPQDW